MLELIDKWLVFEVFQVSQEILVLKLTLWRVQVKILPRQDLLHVTLGYWRAEALLVEVQLLVRGGRRHNRLLQIHGILQLFCAGLRTVKYGVFHLERSLLSNLLLHRFL